MGDRPARDAMRNAWMRGQGLRVIRFNAPDVMNDLGSVVTGIIREALRELPLHHASHGPPPHEGVGRN